MFKKINDIFISVCLALKNFYIYTACLLALLKLVGWHYGLVSLLMTHQDPRETLALISTLINIAKIKIDEFLPLLEKFPRGSSLLHLNKAIHNELAQQSQPLTASRLRQQVKKLQSWDKQQQDIESAHETSVTITVTASLRKLIKRYPSALHTSMGEFSENIKAYLTTNEKAFVAQEKNLIDASLKLIARFKDPHVTTNLYLYQIANLVWLASNDTSNEIWNGSGSATASNLPQNDLKLRQYSYISTLKAIPLMKQTNAITGETSNLCLTGILDTLLETIDKIHIDVNINYESIDVLLYPRFQQLFQDAYEHLEASEKELFHQYPGNKNREIGEWLKRTHEWIMVTLFNEFSPMISQEKIAAACKIEYLLEINLPSDQSHQFIPKI